MSRLRRYWLFTYKKEYLEQIKGLALGWSNAEELLDKSRLAAFEQSFTSTQEKFRLETNIGWPAPGLINEKLMIKI